MANKYYLACPDCRKRMRRTGKKEKEHQDLDGRWIYRREYECPSCGLTIGYSENRNAYSHASF